MAASVPPAPCHTPGPLVQLTHGDSLALAHSLQCIAIALGGKVGQPMLLRPFLPHMVRRLEGHTPACQPGTSRHSLKPKPGLWPACRCSVRPSPRQTGHRTREYRRWHAGMGVCCSTGLPERAPMQHLQHPTHARCASSPRLVFEPHRSRHATFRRSSFSSQQHRIAVAEYQLANGRTTHPCSRIRTTTGR